MCHITWWSAAAAASASTVTYNAVNWVHCSTKLLSVGNYRHEHAWVLIVTHSLLCTRAIPTLCFPLLSSSMLLYDTSWSACQLHAASLLWVVQYGILRLTTLYCNRERLGGKAWVALLYTALDFISWYSCSVLFCSVMSCPVLFCPVKWQDKATYDCYIGLDEMRMRVWVRMRMRMQLWNVACFYWYYVISHDAISLWEDSRSTSIVLTLLLAFEVPYHNAGTNQQNRMLLLRMFFNFSVDVLVWQMLMLMSVSRVSVKCSTARRIERSLAALMMCGLRKTSKQLQRYYHRWRECIE